ncbi:MAG: transketolase [Ktedonobacteraceae bacterium]|nr:transketolase [Ktedonobacteraceae bacterium]
MPREASSSAADTGYDLEQLCINAIRVLAMDAVQQANSGHPGLPLGAAPMAYTLWTRHLRHNPANPAWPNRDRFVLSAGHGSMLLYSLLYLTGYPLSLDELKRFRQWGSRTPGHPEYRLTPGVETTTGPLGQGFANGVGLALAERFLAAHFNRPDYAIINHFTYGIVSDGDLMEGVAAEAASLAGHLGLGKLIYLYDQNGISLAGATALTFSEDVMARFASYGWQVQQVEDGNDVAALDAALQRARADEAHPSLICVRTHIGYGSPHKQDTFEAHGSPLGADEVRLTRQCLGWPFEEPFYVPDEVLTFFRQALEQGAAQEAAWQQQMAAYREAYPDLFAEYEQVLAGILPDGWDDAMPHFTPEDGPMATRKASGKVLNVLAGRLWNLVGGSADLNPSTNTALAGRGDFQRPLPESAPAENPVIQGAAGGQWGWGGQNVHFGVREHAMGAILNGMALHGGLIAYGATFLTFADYMRPPMRLAALMGLGVKYVFTHDSIAIGEDGPTHQPVEHLASLRAIPHLVVIRPADANEVVEAWRIALAERHRPVALILTRQDLPIFEREHASLAGAEGVARGAYVLAEAPGDGTAAPELVLIGTGSEVALCLAAREQLVAQGRRVRVVSMPSWELFDEQPATYRTAVLGPAGTPRLAVEAGISQGWCRYTGEYGATLSVERFGASAPGKEVLRRYGFTVEQVVTRALALLDTSSHLEQ